jgi:choline monooxygenase
MFVHQHYLQYLLRPEHYTCPEHLQREIDLLLRPAWQFLCAKSELPDHGDFITLNLFGEPLQIRNVNGWYHALQNVCPHRHSLLTDESRGRSETIRCQYYGWEFQPNGCTGRIPDARCFRPWDRENAQLKQHRLESCGDLLFVNLTSDAPALRDWLEPCYDETEEAFRAPHWQMRHVWEYDCDCNWKVPAENTLESYHVPAVHSKSLGGMLPAEDQSHHTLTDRYTSLDFEATSRLEAVQATIQQRLGGVPTSQYRHRFFHPNLVLCSTDTINYALMYQPTSAKTVRIRVRFFGVRGTRRGPLAPLVSLLTWQAEKRKTLEVHGEDRDIYTGQQCGLEASSHRGVIGTREERLYVFQKYILNSLGLPVPQEFVPAASTSTNEQDSSAGIGKELSRHDPESV